jgi:hypothetical protein
LKSVPDIRDWVLDLLEILETNLQHGMYHKSVLEIQNWYPLPNTSNNSMLFALLWLLLFTVLLKLGWSKAIFDHNRACVP